jgi:hypothetical protein
MAAREFFSGRSRVRVPLGHNYRQPPGPLSRPPEISCSFRVMASGGTFPTEHFAPLVQSSSFHRAVCPQRPPPPRNPPVAATTRRPPAPTLPRHHSHPPLCLKPRRAHPILRCAPSHLVCCGYGVPRATTTLAPPGGGHRRCACAWVYARSLFSTSP